MYYTDAHTHLNSDQLYPDRPHHLQSFADVGGAKLVNIGVNHERNQRAITISQQAAQQFPDLVVKSALGLHPGETTFGTISSSADIKTALQELEQLITTHPEHIVAIGECGIDSHYDRDPTIQELQTQLFIAQCDLARSLELPIIIHSRDNFELTHQILQNYTDLKIYLHCRGYTPDDIRTCIATFPHLWIGFTGTITYPKAISIKESLLTLHEHITTHDDDIHFLIETDAPYLSPQTYRGKQNIPAHITATYAYIANLLDSPLQDICDTQAAHFAALYDKP